MTAMVAVREVARLRITNHRNEVTARVKGDVDQKWQEMVYNKQLGWGGCIGEPIIIQVQGAREIGSGLIRIYKKALDEAGEPLNQAAVAVILEDLASVLGELREASVAHANEWCDKLNFKDTKSQWASKIAQNYSYLVEYLSRSLEADAKAHELQRRSQKSKPTTEAGKKLMGLLPLLTTLSVGLVVTGVYQLANRLPSTIGMYLVLGSIFLGVSLVVLIVLIHYQIPPLRIRNHLLSFGIVTLLSIVGIPRFIGLLAQTSLKAQAPSPANTQASVANKIFLYERYGGEWHTSNSEPILFANNTAVLRKKFVEGAEYRFTPTIYNSTKTATVANPVQLFINLPTEIMVKKPSLWVIADIDADTQYVANIPADIPPGASNTLNESLFVVFPGPGRYPATYSIHGTTRTGEGFSTVRRTFYFELTE